MFHLDQFLGGSRDPPRADAEDQSRGAKSIHPHRQGTHTHTHTPLLHSTNVVPGDLFALKTHDRVFNVEIVRNEQPSRRHGGGVGPAERSHLQTHQNMGGEYVDPDFEDKPGLFSCQLGGRLKRQKKKDTRTKGQ